MSDYTGLNFNEAVKLDCITYALLVRDGFIHKMSQSQEGREYLEQAWILTQTSPDKGSLRKQFSG